MNWIKKNWFKLLIVFVSIIVILWVGRTCSDAIHEKKIGKLDEDITELKEKNIKLEKEVIDYFEGAQANKKIVADLEIKIAESKSRIEELEKEEAKVEEIVMELPPSELVEETREILGCQDILLNEEGILFSVECAREGLLKLKRFSLVEGKYNEAILALSISEEALMYQKRVSWNLYGVAWKLGAQILNLKVIVKKKEQKYELSEKQRKKSFWSGLKIGLTIGAGLTITIVIILPLIKWIF